MYLDNALRYRRSAKYLFNSPAPSMSELRKSERARVNVPINSLYGGRIRLSSNAVNRLAQSGSLKSWFKNLGRKIKNTATKVWNKVSPVAKKIWNGAKKVIDVAANNPVVRGIIEHIPVVGPTINKATKIADTAIDKAESTAKVIKDTGSKVIDSGKRAIDAAKNKDIKGVINEVKNIPDIKKGMEEIRDKAQDLFNTVRPGVSSGVAGAILNNIRRLNFKRFEHVGDMPAQTVMRDWSNFKRVAPYAIFAKDITGKRLTIPAKIHRMLPNAPKTIDNTGGRIFLGAGEDVGRCGAITLTDMDPASGRIHLGEGVYGGKMLDMYHGKSSGRIGLAGAEPLDFNKDAHKRPSGRISLSGKASKDDASLATLKAFFA